MKKIEQARSTILFQTCQLLALSYQSTLKEDNIAIEISSALKKYCNFENESGFNRNEIAKTNIKKLSISQVKTSIILGCINYIMTEELLDKPKNLIPETTKVITEYYNMYKNPINNTINFKEVINIYGKIVAESVCKVTKKESTLKKNTNN